MAPSPGEPGPDPGAGDGGDDDSGLPTSGASTAGPVDATTTSTSEGDTSSGSSGVVVVCGDGVESPGEMCDDGEANDDHAFCTEKCTVNICGDGHKFTDVELCDEGEANSDEYGSFCNVDCTPGSFCGDNVTQVDEGEDCDKGPDNGTMDDASGLTCSTMCRLLALRGFVSEQAFTGDLGGFEGADEKCRVAAFTAGLAEPERFFAFISTGDVSANERLAAKVGEPLAYVLPGGMKFADSYADLVSGGPGDAGISVTEQGEQLLEKMVATNTATNGASASVDHDCAGWTSASKGLSARVGYNALALDDPSWPTWKAEGWWASAQTWSCDKPWFHLYCLEF